MLQTEKYVQIGRLISIDNEKKNFILSNGINKYQLGKLSHLMWDQLVNFTNFDRWYKAFEEKTKHVKAVNLDKNVAELLTKKLIHPWDFKTVDDEVLLNLTIVRQGFPKGLLNDKWFVSDYSSKKHISLPKETYIVWAAATNHSCLLEVIYVVAELLSISEERALELVKENGPNLIRLKLWAVEFLDISEVK